MKSASFISTCRLATILAGGLLLHSSNGSDHPGVPYPTTGVEIETRIQHFREVASECLEVRKQLAVDLPDSPDAATLERKLVQKLERLERWKSQLRGEIEELGRVQPGLGSVTATEFMAPSGHYLIMLRRSLKGGKDTAINVLVEGSRIRCVSSTDRELVGMEGELKTADNGAVRVWLRKDNFAETHTWIPVPGGRYRVLESPDRGENQIAIPVPDERLKPE